MIQPAEIATHIDWCRSRKSMLEGDGFKVFQSFYAALNSVQKNRQVV
jgi:hypothetical protein